MFGRIVLSVRYGTGRGLFFVSPTGPVWGTGWNWTLFSPFITIMVGLKDFTERSEVVQVNESNLY